VCQSYHKEDWLNLDPAQSSSVLSVFNFRQLKDVQHPTYWMQFSSRRPAILLRLQCRYNCVSSARLQMREWHESLHRVPLSTVWTSMDPTLTPKAQNTRYKPSLMYCCHTQPCNFCQIGMIKTTGERHCGDHTDAEGEASAGRGQRCQMWWSNPVGTKHTLAHNQLSAAGCCTPSLLPSPCCGTYDTNTASLTSNHY